jgi:hypothetical protein
MKHYFGFIAAITFITAIVGRFVIPMDIAVVRHFEVIAWITLCIETLSVKIDNMPNRKGK